METDINHPVLNLPRVLPQSLRICPPLYLAALGWLAAAVSLLAVTGIDWRVDQWRAEQGGLPQNNLQGLTQARNGYLWITTWHGLVRFDGARFALFDQAVVPELVSDSCGPVTEDANGAIWLGTSAGLVRMTPEGFTRFGRAAGIAFDRVTHLLWDARLGLWCGGEGGVARWEDGKFRAYTPADGLLDHQVRWLLPTAAGELAVATVKGIVVFDPPTGRFRPATQEITPGNRLLPVAQTSGARGSFLAATETELWRKLPGQGWAPLLGSAEATPSECRLLAGDTGGRVWFQRRDGALRRWQDGVVSEVSLGVHLVPPQINALHEDNEGNLWLASQAHGLFRLTPLRVRSHTARDGLPHDHVLSVSVARDGGVWAATERGAGRLHQGRWETWRNTEPVNAPNELRMRNNFTTVLGRADGSVWFGTWGRALYRWEPGQTQLAHFGMSAEWVVDHVSSLYEDRAGATWVGSGGRGVVRFRADERTSLSPKSSLSNGDVTCALQTRDGAHWFGTKGGGLNRWQAGTNAAYTMRDGLPSDAITALHEDAEGALWIGTNRGLGRHAHGQFKTFTIREGLLDDLINGLLEDDFGCFWISCNRGIARIRRADLNAVAAGRLKSVSHVAVGEVDGMASAETNGGAQPSAAKSPDGRLWFPTIRGVVEIDPARWRDNTNAPPVVIEEVLAAGQPVPFRSSGQLAPGSGRAVEFQYTATSFTDPARVRFRCRLEGHESEWREFGARRIATYTNLKPGPYRFQVTACNHHGYWNADGAAFAFVIAPHYYETHWFLGACASLLLGGVAGAHAYRLRVARRFAEQQRQHALELERARIARDLHDNLGAGLSQVALLGELASQSETNGLGQESLVRLAEQARSAQRSLNEVVWAASARHDTLAGLLNYLADFAPQLCASAGVRCRFEFPTPAPERGLDGPVRHHLFLIAKEALNNVVRHAQAQTVTLGATLRGEELELTVTDDGRGFEVAEAAARERASGGNGLPNLHARAVEAGARLTIDSTSGRGTTVRVTLRLPPASRLPRTGD